MFSTSTLSSVTHPGFSSVSCSASICKKCGDPARNPVFNSACQHLACSDCYTDARCPVCNSTEGQKLVCKLDFVMEALEQKSTCNHCKASLKLKEVIEHRDQKCVFYCCSMQWNGIVAFKQHKEFGCEQVCSLCEQKFIGTAGKERHEKSACPTKCGSCGQFYPGSEGETKHKSDVCPNTLIPCGACIESVTFPYAGKEIEIAAWPCVFKTTRDKMSFHKLECEVLQKKPKAEKAWKYMQKKMQKKRKVAHEAEPSEEEEEKEEEEEECLSVVPSEMDTDQSHPASPSSNLSSLAEISAQQPRPLYDKVVRMGNIPLALSQPGQLTVIQGTGKGIANDIKEAEAVREPGQKIAIVCDSTTEATICTHQSQQQGETRWRSKFGQDPPDVIEDIKHDLVKYTFEVKLPGFKNSTWFSYADSTINQLERCYTQLQAATDLVNEWAIVQVGDRFQCPRCKLLFKSSQGTKQHIKYKHNNLLVEAEQETRDRWRGKFGIDPAKSTEYLTHTLGKCEIEVDLGCFEPRMFPYTDKTSYQTQLQAAQALVNKYAPVESQDGVLRPIFVCHHDKCIEKRTWFYEKKASLQHMQTHVFEDDVFEDSAEESFLSPFEDDIEEFLSQTKKNKKQRTENNTNKLVFDD